VIINDVSVIREREISDGTSLPTEVTVFKVCASGGANGYQVLVLRKSRKVNVMARGLRGPGRLGCAVTVCLRFIRIVMQTESTVEDIVKTVRR
jgi:hypothetical protein